MSENIGGKPSKAASTGANIVHEPKEIIIHSVKKLFQAQNRLFAIVLQKLFI